MTLTPILTATPAIQMHVLAALAAALLGPLALYRARRDLVHRIAGYLWVLSMVAAALTSFGITTFQVIGPFSPIHLLSGLVLVSLGQGVAHVRAGRIARHAAEMRGLYWNALGLAGLFTFLPGRVMNRTLFEAAPQAGYGLIALGGMALIWAALRRRRLLA